MMRSLLLMVAAASLLGAAPKKPRLVLVVVVDQCRYDYLIRFGPEFTGGFARLLKNGASFTNAQNDFYPTLTAVGHATMLTGAMPSAHGVIGNDWFDRAAGKKVTSVSDPETRLVGGKAGTGSSPRNLLVSTVGDELKQANPASHVFGISIKDRSAILLTGKKADGAYWYDEGSGNYVTSTYYRRELPAWVQSFDDTRPTEQYRDATWLTHKLPDRARTFYKSISWSPFGNEILEAVVERAITAENLGQDDDADLLAVSFSGTDYVGHDYGPDSPEIHHAMMRMDGILDRLLQTVDASVGLANTLVVLTSDHGVSPFGDKTRGGRILLTLLSDAVQAALAKKYGPGKWIAGIWDEQVYINHNLVAEKKLDLREVNRFAAATLAAMPHIARVYTREQLMSGGDKKMDASTRLVKNGFYLERAADLMFNPEAYWVFTTDLETTHGSTYAYDTHIPLIFMGAGIRAGRYNSPVVSNDIAPTLADILGVPKPSAASGRVLTQMYAQ